MKTLLATLGFLAVSAVVWAAPVIVEGKIHKVVPSEKEIYVISDANGKKYEYYFNDKTEIIHKGVSVDFAKLAKDQKVKVTAEETGRRLDPKRVEILEYFCFPTFFAKELWHPLIVHFPIALLPLGAILYLLGVSGRYFEKYLPLVRVILYLGATGAWISVWTGNRAESIVNRVICDPGVTHQHGDWASYSTYIFTALIVLETALYFAARRWKKIPQKILQGVLAVLLLFASTILLRASHIGVSLVYQQGAGVFHPSADCREFPRE